MPKTKTKGKSEFQIRRVKSKEDRRRPSVFMRLKTDEAFKGIALFEPDPELDDNPGYYEYYDHFDKQGNSYVPCAGDKCPFCAANDNPSTRALTVWYFPEAADEKDKIKVFTMNYSTIGDISDEAEEEDGILGKKVRIKRLSDKGDYKVRVLSDKPLSKAELKALRKQLSEMFPDGLEGLVLKQLKTQMERLKAMDALEDDEIDDDDDEDDDDEPKGKARKGKAEDDDDDEDEDEDSDEDDEDSDDDDDDDDDEDESDDEEESDDDDDEDEDDEDSDEDEDSEEDEEIKGQEYEVVKVNEADETIDLKSDDGKVKMWVGEGVNPDYDEVKKGANVKLDATKDQEGDWIITKISVVKPKGGKGKGGKKK